MNITRKSLFSTLLLCAALVSLSACKEEAVKKVEEPAPVVAAKPAEAVIVTAPMLTHAVKVDLPKASSSLNVTKPDNVQLAIDAESHLYWNGAPIEADALKVRLHDAAALQPQPELHIRADRTTPYEKVAQVMSMAASEGLGKIGFITDPSTPAP